MSLLIDLQILSSQTTTDVVLTKDQLKKQNTNKENTK